MTRIKEFNIDGYKITFINTWRGSPSGFMHHSELYINEWDAAEATCHYINRTWERYAYQTVMLEAVNNLREKTTRRAKQAFLYSIGRKNLMDLNKPAFLEYLKNNDTIKLCEKLEEVLR